MFGGQLHLRVELPLCIIQLPLEMLGGLLKLGCELFLGVLELRAEMLGVHLDHGSQIAGLILELVGELLQLRGIVIRCAESAGSGGSRPGSCFVCGRDTASHIFPLIRDGKADFERRFLGVRIFDTKNALIEKNSIFGDGDTAYSTERCFIKRIAGETNDFFTVDGNRQLRCAVLPEISLNKILRIGLFVCLYALRSFDDAPLRYAFGIFKREIFGRFNFSGVLIVLRDGRLGAD